MPEYIFDIAAIYRDIKITAEDEEKAREIAVMTLRDRWYDTVIATRQPVLDLDDHYCGC